MEREVMIGELEVMDAGRRADTHRVTIRGVAAAAWPIAEALDAEPRLAAANVASANITLRIMRLSPLVWLGANARHVAARRDCTDGAPPMMGYGATEKFSNYECVNF